MATEQGGDGSSQTWQRLATVQVLPAPDWEDQVSCQIAAVVRDLALPTTTVTQLKGAIVAAVGNVLAQSREHGYQPSIFLTISLPSSHIDLQQGEEIKKTASTPPRLYGWSFFLIERLAVCEENNGPCTPYLVELYLYLEGESCCL